MVHGDQGIPQTALIFSAINLLIFIGIIYYFSRDSVKNVLASRHNKIKEDIERAYEELREAGRLLEASKVKLNNIGLESKKLIEDMEEAAKILKDKILNEAKKTSDVIVTDAKKRAEQEVLRVKKQLIDDVVLRVIEVSREAIIKENAKEQESGKLVESFLSAVQGAGRE